jgi:hypothetical protein
MEAQVIRTGNSEFPWAVIEEGRIRCSFQKLADAIHWAKYWEYRVEVNHSLDSKAS